MHSFTLELESGLRRFLEANKDKKRLKESLIENTIQVIKSLVMDIPGLPAPKMDLDSQGEIGLSWARDSHRVEMDIDSFGNVSILYYGKVTGKTWTTTANVNTINSEEIINQMKWIL